MSTNFFTTEQLIHIRQQELRQTMRRQALVATLRPRQPWQLLARRISAYALACRRRATTIAPPPLEGHLSEPLATAKCGTQ